MVATRSALGSEADWLMGAVFDQLPSPAFIYDDELTISGLNRAAEGLLHLSAGGTVGRACEEAFGCRECDPGCAMRTTLHAMTSMAGIVRFGCGGPREQVMRTRVTPLLGPSGERRGAVVTLLGPAGRAAGDGQVVAESEAMRKLLSFAQRVAASNASTVLLQGENGTGKEVVARILHCQSLRGSHPMISINCAAMPETLLESELFGYERGSFTDARVQKKGLFELANRGTLFLDEVGELPPKLQAKLLRVIEDQTFRRLGGLENVRVDLRIVAATNRNLRDAVAEGAFRQDLYYRLNVIEIEIPPLRQRREDILPLAAFFVGQYNQKFNRSLRGLSSESAGLFLRYDWPGNVRELRNAIERAMILEDGEAITPASLPPPITETPGSYRPARPSLQLVAEGDLPPLEVAERRLLERALEKTQGNQAKAARLLGISRDTLRYRMKKFDISFEGPDKPAGVPGEGTTACA